MTAPIFKATMSFDEAMAAIECARPGRRKEKRQEKNRPPQHGGEING